MKLPCWLWFLVLLGFGLLLLLMMIHLPDLSDTVQQQNSGVLVLVAPRWPVEKDSATAQQSRDIDAGRFRGSLPSLHQRQSITPCSDLFLSSKHQVTKGHRKLLKTFPSGGERALQQSRRRLMNYVCSRYRPVIGKQQMTRQVIRKQLTKQWLTRKQLSRIYVEDRFRLLYCEVPKAGCSNWKRVLMVLGGSADSVWDIPHDAAHYANHLRRLENYNPAGVAERLLTYTKVLFVREPFERLVSAFRDKFENPNSYYHHVFGRAIISRYRVNASRRALSTGTGVTFREFVQYLLDPKRPIGMDIHWEPVNQLCSPCLFRYHFIGKFESLEKDANFLLHHIGAPANLTFPDFKDRNPHAERTSSRISQNYLSKLNATEQQKVFEFYLRDYQMFSYPKPVSHLHYAPLSQIRSLNSQRKLV